MVFLRCSPGILAKKWVILELIATKSFFADFTSTRKLEHHIKNLSKSTFGKLLKIVVLKNSGFCTCMETRLRTSFLALDLLVKENVTEKSFTHITELLKNQYFKFLSKISCNFAKIYLFLKIQNGGQMQNGEHWELWANWLVKMAWSF